MKADETRKAREKRRRDDEIVGFNLKQFEKRHKDRWWRVKETGT